MGSCCVLIPQLSYFDLQLILKQYRFELHGSTYRKIFFPPISTVNAFSLKILLIT